MTPTPNYCPKCKAAGVIATAGGPTCTHHEAHDAKWFPPWWSEAAFDGDKRRVEWLELQQPKKCP